MTDAQSKSWFAPKAVGYGAMPITWEGYALVIAFVVAVALAAWFLILRPTMAGMVPSLAAIVAFLLIDLVLVGGLIIVAKAKSSAEWHWRSGPADKA